MKKFIIERDLSRTGKLTPAALKAFAVKSCEVISHLETPYHWIETFVTDTKMYCIHIAPDRETALEYARQSGFSVDHIAEIKNIVDATTSVLPVEKQPRRVFE